MTNPCGVVHVTGRSLLLVFSLFLADGNSHGMHFLGFSFLPFCIIQRQEIMLSSVTVSVIFTISEIYTDLQFLWLCFHTILNAKIFTI